VGTELSLQKLLSLLESNRPASEFNFALSEISVLFKEPEKIEF
jgi:hypothetical protein